MFEEELKFLKEAGCGYLPHTGRTLYDHLLGTANILLEYERPDAEVKAGLFHSIYGTDIYPFSKRISITRESVSELIGEEAEEIVHIFCSLEPRTEKIINGDVDKKYIDSLRWIEYASIKEQNTHSRNLVPLRILLGL